MALADQMRPLVHHLAEAHRGRMADVADFRHASAEMLAELQRNHRQMAKDQRQRSAAQMGAFRARAAKERKRRAADVDTLRAETADLLANAATVQGARAAEQRRRLASHVAELREAATETLHELQTNHEQMAKDQRQRLAAQMETFGAEAAERRERRAGFVDDLRNDTATFLEDLNSAREAMAREQRDQLVAERSRLASDVADTRESVQDDLGEARRLWRSLEALKRGKRARATAPTPSSERAAEPTRDDLTQIRGLGAAMERRLTQAGIVSFAELATRTPDELRKALGEAARAAKVNEWIKQARQLSGL